MLSPAPLWRSAVDPDCTYPLRSGPFRLWIEREAKLRPKFYGWTKITYLVIMPNKKMLAKQKTRYESRANVLKSLAHPTRLFLVEKLADKSYCVRELTELIDRYAWTLDKIERQFPENFVLQDVRDWYTAFRASQGM